MFCVGHVDRTLGPSARGTWESSSATGVGGREVLGSPGKERTAQKEKREAGGQVVTKVETSSRGRFASSAQRLCEAASAKISAWRAQDSRQSIALSAG